MKNNYYDIAYYDLLHLEEDYHKTIYNPMIFQIHQVTEKMLKSVIELVQTNIESLLHSDNLLQLYLEINKVVPTFILDEMELFCLTDMYRSVGYPGDNFITVSHKQCAECLSTMYKVLIAVNDFREENGLEIYPITEKFLSDDLNKANSF